MAKEATLKAGRSNKDLGFTLIEILIVLVILSVLVAVTVPKLSAYNSDKSATNDLLRAMLIEAKEEAIFKGRPFRLTINRDDLTVAIGMLEVDGFLKKHTGPKKLPGCIDNVKVSINGMEKHGASVVATIRPDGWMDEAIISIDGCNSNSYKLRLSGIAGIIDDNYEK